MYADHIEVSPVLLTAVLTTLCMPRISKWRDAPTDNDVWKVLQDGGGVGGNIQTTADLSVLWSCVQVDTCQRKCGLNTVRHKIRSLAVQQKQIDRYVPVLIHAPKCHTLTPTPRIHMIVAGSSAICVWAS